MISGHDAESVRHLRRRALTQRCTIVQVGEVAQRDGAGRLIGHGPGTTTLYEGVPCKLVNAGSRELERLGAMTGRVYRWLLVDLEAQIALGSQVRVFEVPPGGSAEELVAYEVHEYYQGGRLLVSRAG